MKKFLALTLTLALCLGLGVTALADGPDGPPSIPEGWTPADGARIPADGARADEPETVDVPVPAQYAATVTVDGKEVDFSGIPGAPGGYVPMRALCEAAGGSAEWYPEENEALFIFDEKSIAVHLNDLTVSIGFDPVEGVNAYLNPAGYTFIPVSVLDELESVSVNLNLELDVERYDIKTSASDPDMQLVRSIMEAVDSAAGMRHTAAEMEEYMGIRQENFTSIIGYFPMMINADTVVIGQVADGKMDAAKEDLEARKQTTVQSFENYLPDGYEMAKNGQIVVAPDGSHIMLIISGDNAKAIELFNAAYPAAE